MKGMTLEFRYTWDQLNLVGYDVYIDAVEEITVLKETYVATERIRRWTVEKTVSRNVWDCSALP